MEKTREQIMQEMLQNTQQNINESVIGKEEFLTEVAIPVQFKLWMNTIRDDPNYVRAGSHWLSQKIPIIFFHIHIISLNERMISFT